MPGCTLTPTLHSSLSSDSSLVKLCRLDLCVLPSLSSAQPPAFFGIFSDLHSTEQFVLESPRSGPVLREKAQRLLSRKDEPEFQESDTTVEQTYGPVSKSCLKHQRYDWQLSSAPEFRECIPIAALHFAALVRIAHRHSRFSTTYFGLSYQLHYILPNLTSWPLFVHELTYDVQFRSSDNAQLRTPLRTSADLVQIYAYH